MNKRVWPSNIKHIKKNDVKMKLLCQRQDFNIQNSKSHCPKCEKAKANYLNLHKVYTENTSSYKTCKRKLKRKRKHQKTFLTNISSANHTCHSESDSLVTLQICCLSWDPDKKYIIIWIIITELTDPIWQTRLQAWEEINLPFYPKDGCSRMGPKTNFWN